MTEREELAKAQKAWYDAQDKEYEARMTYYERLVEVDSETAASISPIMADEWIDATTYEKE